MPHRRYYAWCEQVVRRFRLWQIILFGYVLPIVVFLNIFSLPWPFVLFVLPVGGILFFAWSWFCAAHFDYWSRNDEWTRSDSYKRTMKVRDIVDKTFKLRK